LLDIIFLWQTELLVLSLTVLLVQVPHLTKLTHFERIKTSRTITVGL